MEIPFVALFRDKLFYLENAMAIRKSFKEVKANFAEVLDLVTERNKIVLVERPDKQTVALIAADELRSLIETVHLLRSPKNAVRLHTALERVRGRAPKLPPLPKF